jgi:hypothetical protein
MTFDAGRAGVAVDDMAHAAVAQAVATGEVAVGNDQSSAEPVWRDSSPLGRGRARSSPGNRAAGRSSSGAPEAAA